MPRPMLDDLELQQVQTIEVDGDQVWTQHAIPALEGDFFQGLGRRASQVTLTGVLTGAEVADGLKKLRDKFRAAAPASFVADIATATRLDQVLIEEMGVRELAGRPSRFEYAFTLREFIPATPTEIEIPPPPPPPPPPKVEESTLEVEVIVEGDENFDHSKTRVRVAGTSDDGQSISEDLPNDAATRQGKLWTVTPFPPGNYTATATTDSPVMTGSDTVVLPLGQKERAVITLRQGQAIATAFMVHYWFDKAFVEPCMRPVLRQVAAFATANQDQRLIIVGHTDESGIDQYNESLADRRSRGVYAYLTFGRDLASADAAVAMWDELRKTRTGTSLSVRDNWGARQYQLMLQDLGFYNSQITDAHDTATAQAVSDFQTANGLSVDGFMGDQTWPILIRAYMAQDKLSVPEDQLMPNADPATDCKHGFVRWLGCGEKLPVLGTPVCSEGAAWRPNRRTEMLFVRATAFPCPIPEPETFRLAPVGGPDWCLGPGNTGKRCCFLTREADEQDKFLVQPAESGSFIVNGRILFEDGTPLANTEYTLIAPDGEFMNGEHTCQPPNGVRKGTPIHGRTDVDGNLTEATGVVGYPGKPKGPGIYTLEIHANVVARAGGEPLSAAKGPVVCKRLDGSSPFNVILCRAATTFDLQVTGASQIGGSSSTTFLATRSAADVVVISAVSPPGTCLKVGSIVWSGGDAVPGNPFQRSVSRGTIGQTTVTATMVATAATKSVDILVVRVTLDVDADRDGVVEEDAAGKNAWEFGVGKKGAVISCNNDDDNSDTAQDNLNDQADGADDVNDLTSLMIRQSGPLPAGVTLELSVADQSKIRVFNQRSSTGTAVIGPTPLPATFNITNSAAADVELGMEATEYPKSGFDGLIRLALSLKEGGTELAKDELVVRVAPWIMPSHLQVTEEIYVFEFGFNTSPASPFMDGVQAAATTAGITLKRANGSTYGEQWMQDNMEVGYSQTPTHAFSVVLNAVNLRGPRVGLPRGIEAFAPDELLGKDYGLEQPPFNASVNTFDSHGNIEVSPPVTVAGKDFKFGRIFFGRGRPTTPFNSTVKAFLNAQLIQKPFELDTDWLGVGHVDEIISFVPSTVGRPFRMLFSSTTEAIRILTDLQDAGHGALTLFTGKVDAEFGERSIDSILGDATLMAGNTFCQSRLDGVEATLKTELDLSDADIIKLPGLFIEESSFPGIFAAHIPGMVNMLVITRPAFSDTQLVIPKPFGPVLGGVDHLEKDVQDKLTPLGYATSQIRFVDDFEPYHVNFGEVHCGTNSKRNPHPNPWWEQEDF